MCESVLEGKGKFINRPTKTRNRTYDKYFFYVTTDVVKDSAFPFKEGDDVAVIVDPVNHQIIIKKKGKSVS